MMEDFARRRCGLRGHDATDSVGDGEQSNISREGETDSCLIITTGVVSVDGVWTANEGGSEDDGGVRMLRKAFFGS